MDEKDTANSGNARLLTGLLAGAIAVVTVGIGWVCCNCIDSVQKRTAVAKVIPDTPENTKVDSHKFDFVNKQEDSEILSGELNPNLMIENNMAKLVGSESFANSGAKAIDKGDYDQGIFEFTQVLAMVPDEATKKTSWHAGGHVVGHDNYVAYAYEMRSFCYLQQKKYKAAMDDLNTAIKLRPAFAMNYENRAKLYMLTGHKEQAAADLKEAQSLPPYQKGTYP